MSEKKTPSKVDNRSLIDQVEKLFNLKRPETWFSALRQRHSLKEKEKYMAGVRDAADTYGEMHESVSAITKDNLQAKIDAQSEQFQAQKDLSAAAREEAAAYYANTQKRVDIQTASLDADLEEQKLRKERIASKRDSRNADVDQYAERERVEMRKRQAKKEIEEEERLIELKRKKKRLAELDALRNEDINDLALKFAAAGKEFDLQNPTPEAEKAAMEINNRYEILKRDVFGS